MYVKQTVIPEKGNPKCVFFRANDLTGELTEITSSAFHTARRKGAEWEQIVTLRGEWVATAASPNTIHAKRPTKTKEE